MAAKPAFAVKKKGKKQPLMGLEPSDQTPIKVKKASVQMNEGENAYGHPRGSNSKGNLNRDGSMQRLVDEKQMGPEALNKVKEKAVPKEYFKRQA